ncbi:hypothetical protein ACOSP7_011308 [Xanthoceras sorbifolium]
MMNYRVKMVPTNFTLNSLGTITFSLGNFLRFLYLILALIRGMYSSCSHSCNLSATVYKVILYFNLVYVVFPRAKNIFVYVALIKNISVHPIMWRSFSSIVPGN